MELKSQNNSRTHPMPMCPNSLLWCLCEPLQVAPLSQGQERRGWWQEQGFGGLAPWAKRWPKSPSPLKDEDISAEFISFILSDLKGITMKTNYTFTPPPLIKRKSSWTWRSVVTGGEGVRG